MRYRFIKLRSIDSTQLEASRVAHSCTGMLDNSRVVICAANQTHGRGQKGRAWISSAGNNLYLSVIDKYHNIPHQLSISTLPLVISIAVSSAIEEIINNGSIKVSVKWPNDVLINGKKVAGVLVERIVVQNQYFYIVGIGINIESAPCILQSKTTSILEEVKNLDHNIHSNYNHVVNRVMHYLNYYQQLWKAEGFENIKKIWLSRAFCLNTQLTIKYNNIYESGIFCGVNQFGQLLLRLGNDNINVYSSLDEMLFHKLSASS